MTRTSGWSPACSRPWKTFIRGLPYYRCRRNSAVSGGVRCTRGAVTGAIRAACPLGTLLYGEREGKVVIAGLVDVQISAAPGLARGFLLLTRPGGLGAFSRAKLQILDAIR